MWSMDVRKACIGVLCVWFDVEMVGLFSCFGPKMCVSEAFRCFLGHEVL